MDRRPEIEVNVAERVMDLARWAASADNAQTWRFEFTGHSTVRVHAHGLGRETGVFDFGGAATLMALGGLIETASQAATCFACRTQVYWREAPGPHRYVFDLCFEPEPGLQPSALAAYIEARATQRGGLSRRALSMADKWALQDAAGNYRLVWLEERERTAAAWLNFRLADARLRIPELYPNLAVTFNPDPNVRFTQTRMPAASLPVDPLTRHLVVWALQSQARLVGVSRLLGTAPTRLLLDLIPGLRCAAQIGLMAPGEPKTQADHVAAGRAFARLWLCAEQRGIRMQPEYMALEFSRQVRADQPITRVPALRRKVQRLAKEFEDLLSPAPVRSCVMLARLGYGPATWARSLRLPLQDLLYVRP